MSRELEILDRNLALLFTRAYAPVPVREGFRQRLERDFVAHAAEIAARPRWGSQWARPVLAVAAALALITVGWLAYLASTAAGGAQGFEGLLARGEVAVRRERNAPWRSAGDRALAVEGGYLAVATPDSRAADVTVAAAAERADWDVAPRSVVEIEAHASVEAHLNAGELVARRGAEPGEGPWRIATAHGPVDLALGSARIAYERDGARVRVAVERGDALAGSSRAQVRDGAKVWLANGDVVDAAGVAVAEPSRTGVETVPDEPVAPVEPDSDAVALRGSVTRSSDGSPVDAFRVVILPRVQLPQVGEPLVFEFEAAAGRFSIARASVATALANAATFRVEVQSEGLAPARVASASLGRAPLDLALELGEGATVRGIVVDAANGIAIPGAWVVAEHDTPLQVLAIDPAEVEVPQVVTSTRAKDDGGFEIAHLGAGKQLLRASAPGYGPFWSELLELSDGEARSGIEIRLQPAARIHGTVLDDAGEPIANVALIASTTDFERLRPCLTFDFALTSTDGGFELGDLGAGAWVVLNLGPASAIRPSITPQMAFATLAPGASVRLDFHAERPARRLFGSVRDAAGGALAGRNLMIARREAAVPPPEGSWTYATTDARGDYEIPNLEPGAYEACISGSVPSALVRIGPIEVAEDRDTRLDFDLPAGSISGHVRRGDSREPLEFAVLVLTRELPAGGAEFFGRVFTDASGLYELSHLPPGTYTLTAYGPEGDLGQATSAAWTLAEGERLESVDFDLAPGGSIAVRVVDSEGAGVAGATIVLRDARGGEVQFSERTLTDARGEYVASGVAPGRWTAEARLAERVSLAVELEVTAGGRAEVELRLGGKR